jgi:hypothetical protein
MDIFKRKFILIYFQRFLLRLSYNFFKLNPFSKTEERWVIGVDGICGLSYQISKILRGYSVCMYQDDFYENLSYGFIIENKRFSRMKRLLTGPFLLGYLANKYRGFFYISDSRFLVNHYDQGEYELFFLKSKGKKIVLWFTGSDIRSVILSRKNKLPTDFEDYSDVIPLDNPRVLSIEYDNIKRNLASVADKHSDLIYNFELDQNSYIYSDTLNTRIILSEDFFNFDRDKFQIEKNDLIKILHITSNPIIKGTPLVLSAINRLKLEGFSFDFEIISGNLSRSQLLSKLRESHIVLNQFYSKIPGHAGLEAMANTNIVLQSAQVPKHIFDPTPWITTHSFEVYDNLKKVLFNFEAYSEVAINGYQYAYDFSHPENVAKEIISEAKSLFNS